jgi:serine/threonine-protein kinase
MRRDLTTIAPHLERARTLASLVSDVPRVVQETAGDADADATAALPQAAITQTIPQPGAPRRRRRGRTIIVVLLAIALVVAAAWGAWTYAMPHHHPVPTVTGLSVGDATRQLNDLGFTVVVAHGRYDDAAATGTVLSVDPAEGTSLREGDTVTLLPSLGPPPVAVPTVTGMTLDNAVASLGAQGLTKGTVTQVYDDTIPQGSVVRQFPADGKAPTGSAVDLWVSKGRAPVPIPAVVGMSQRSAEKALRAAGFTTVVHTAYSNDVQRGDVISVDPGEATKTPYASSVSITVSQGPESFAVPAFTGLSPQAAEAKAKDYGLRVSFFDVPNTPQTTVISQNPAAGATVHAGDTITLFVA